MLFNAILAAEEAASNTPNNKNGWVMWVIIGVVLVLMVVLTIVPQKKRQKEQQKMMSTLTVGTKLMTVGGLVGRITQVNTDNTLIINVGTENSPTLIVIDRKAVGYVLENVAAPAPQVVDSTPAAEPFAEENTVSEAPAEPATETVTVDEVETSATEESTVEENSSISELEDPFGRSNKK